MDVKDKSKAVSEQDRGNTEMSEYFEGFIVRHLIINLTLVAMCIFTLATIMCQIPAPNEFVTICLFIFQPYLTIVFIVFTFSLMFATLAFQESTIILFVLYYIFLFIMFVNEILFHRNNFKRKHSISIVIIVICTPIVLISVHYLIIDILDSLSKVWAIT